MGKVKPTISCGYNDCRCCERCRRKPNCDCDHCGRKKNFLPSGIEGYDAYWQCDKCSVKQQSMELEEAEELEPAEHDDIKCDGCQQCPIRGPRFKSTTREEFDLCMACMRKAPHNTDQYIRIDQPAAGSIKPPEEKEFCTVQ